MTVPSGTNIHACPSLLRYYPAEIDNRKQWELLLLASRATRLTMTRNRRLMVTTLYRSKVARLKRDPRPRPRTLLKLRANGYQSSSVSQLQCGRTRCRCAQTRTASPSCPQVCYGLGDPNCERLFIRWPGTCCQTCCKNHHRHGCTQSS